LIHAILLVELDDQVSAIGIGCDAVAGAHLRVETDATIPIIPPEHARERAAELSSQGFKLFKVKADFDSRMDFNDENLKQYTCTLCAVCGKENLRHLDKKAVAKIVEHSSRLAEDQHKLSTMFSEIADIIREANYWAGLDGKSVINNAHVSRAIEQKVYRSNLIHERIREMIGREILKIDTEGAAVGQVSEPNRTRSFIAGLIEAVLEATQLRYLKNSVRHLTLIIKVDADLAVAFKASVGSIVILFISLVPS
jgi:hypothetical protein